MGRIGKVLQWAARALTGDVQHDTGGGALHRSQLFSDSGVDAPPMPDDYVATVDTQSANRSAAVGVVDGKNASEAQPGERRTYARDSEGVIVVTLHMKADGSARLFNQNGYIELRADGVVEANGATITTDGDVITAAGVSLNNHVHLAGDELIGNQSNPVTGKTAKPEQ